MQTALSRVPLPLRLAAFRALEWAAAARQRMRGQAAPTAAIAAPATQRSLWVFVSTIGELNAIEPFLERLLEELGHPPLTLISDRLNYRSAYLTKYPEAAVETLHGSSAEAQGLARRRPPMMLLVAEIPCQLHDAPCRFSYATLKAVRGAGAPTVLVNGWLYGYAAPSCLDRIEKALFARDYVRGFDLMLVQTEDVRQRLLSAGAAPGQVAVTGNIKFDAMQPAFAASRDTSLRAALAARGSGPIVVAGSVTDTVDQAFVLDAFRKVLDQSPTALLVLAPRHPENLPMMAALERLLQARELDYRWRSQHEALHAIGSRVLILDTMGELRGCYAECTLAFVGKDHSVLEPLAFSKPVFVGPGWESTYPSYPVYWQLLKAGVLLAVNSLEDLGTQWSAYLSAAQEMAALRSQRSEAVLAAARGASERSMNALHQSGLLRRVSPAQTPAFRS